MKETHAVDGGSVLGVLVLGTMGFWTGGFLGLCMGGVGAIPGAFLGMIFGAYLGTDNEPQVIVINQQGERLN